MKKYLFIIPSLSKGGAERVVSLLASELINQNREAVIITHFKTTKDYPINTKVKIICLSNLYEEDYRKKINVFYLIKLIWRLRKAIIKENPDYILPFLWTTCIRADLALLFSREKKKVIQTVRNNPMVYPEKSIMRKYRNNLVKRSKMTIVQNGEQKKYFSHKFQKKIFILPNPISDEIFNIRRKDNDTFDIIGVGRLEEQKNFSLLIDAFKEVYINNPFVRLKIFGEGTLKERLQNKINDLGMEDVATLCGRSNDYNEIYGSASLFVLSSNFEGMPNTLLEAMACGIPCISTNCPTGPKDIIKNNENGFLIEVKNVEELKNTIIECIKTKEKCKEIGKKAAMEMKEKYSVDSITKLLIKYCEKR